MTYDVHPVADLFPMLADDELAELAADIKQRGLLQPIVLDAQGRVLDGRNRLAACRMAGVEPTFTTRELATAADALAFNGQRRDLTAGKRAMIAAKASKLEDLKGSEVARTLRVPESRVSEARTILDHAEDLADRVLAGNMPLVEAYEIAKARRADAEAARARMNRLRDEAPDLLALVEEERMALDDAIAALDAREEKARQEAAQQRTEEQERERKRAEEQRDARALLIRIVELVGPQTMSDQFIDAWVYRLGDLDAELIKRTEQAGRVLLDLAERTKR